jgi:O-antigen/teichoic acid export membrane protein
LPRDPRDHGFRPGILKPVWRFALGSSLIGAMGVVLAQADKWIVLSTSRLEQFTHYSIAAAAAMALYGIVQPVLGALFPRMSVLVAKHDEGTLRSVYHASTQLVAALAFSMGLCLAVFSREALLLWTRNASVAMGAAPIATVLALGTMLNCAMFVPYNLQLAYGWTRLGLYSSFVFLVVLVPAGYLLGTRFGPIGCAAVWLFLNAGYFCCGVWLTHRRLLRGEAAAWYLRDTLPCLLSALLVTGACRMVFPTTASPWVQMALLFLIGALTLGACLLSTSQPRAWLLARAVRATRALGGVRS